LIISRRRLCRDTVLALSSATLFTSGWLGLGGRAFAQAATAAEIAKEGPLPDMTLGKAGAPVTIVEYASTTCPHCAHFYANTFPELKKRYIDTGKVFYIYREFVLNQLDLAAVMLLRCGEKDKYFPLLDTLFQKQETWVVQKPLPPLLAIAKQAGFTEEQFNACLDTQNNPTAKATLEKIQAANEQAQKFGVNSTPAFFINGEIHRGDMSIDEMAAKIDPLLKG